MTIEKQVKKAWFDLGKAEAQAEIDTIMNVLEVSLLGCVTVADYKKVIETLVEAHKGE